MLFEFPAKEEWLAIEDTYPFEKLKISKDTFQNSVYLANKSERMYISNQIFTWTLHLENRLIQTRWSYVLSMFLFNKGIPDDEWYISPGKDGFSTEYFPHFEEKDMFVKAQFDYFIDIFYYKLFSAWDNLGHLLNYMYGLGIEQCSFNKAFKKLEKVKPELFENFKKIVESVDFKKMREFRHSSTHNELLGQVGSLIQKVSENEYNIGSGKYTSSAEIKENITKSLDLFAETLEAIRKQSMLDHQSLKHLINDPL